jgi:hypothetical protein
MDKNPSIHRYLSASISIGSSIGIHPLISIHRYLSVSIGIGPSIRIHPLVSIGLCRYRSIHSYPSISIYRYLSDKYRWIPIDTNRYRWMDTNRWMDTVRYRCRHSWMDGRILIDDEILSSRLTLIPPIFIIPSPYPDYAPPSPPTHAP